MKGRFSRHERLTRAADFQALFQQGKRIDRPSLIVLWRVTGTAARVGFAVSRQVRGAVKRNRVKRRLRAAYRATRSEAPGNVAMVVVGRPRAGSAEFDVLMREFREAFGTIRAAGRAA